MQTLQFPYCGIMNIFLLLLPKTGLDIDCNGTATLNDTAWWWYSNQYLSRKKRNLIALFSQSKKTTT